MVHVVLAPAYLDEHVVVLDHQGADVNVPQEGVVPVGLGAHLGPACDILHTCGGRGQIHQGIIHRLLMMHSMGVLTGDEWVCECSEGSVGCGCVMYNQFLAGTAL